MEEEQFSYAKAAINSGTMRWLLAAGVTHLVKTFGIEVLPDAVSNELIGALVMVLDIAIPAMLAMAAKGRMQATTYINGWFNVRNPVQPD